jgi:hypothetical protein
MPMIARVLVFLAHQPVVQSGVKSLINCRAQNHVRKCFSRAKMIYLNVLASVEVGYCNVGMLIYRMIIQFTSVLLQFY